MLDLRTSVVVLVALASGCTKTESTSSSGTTAPTESTATPATASAPPAESATASATAAASETAPAPSASVAATTSASGKPATPTASGSATAGATECGTKPLPDCPLQAWMKANANPPMLANDLPGLATALDKISALAPPGYTNWASISKDGAKAARDGDMNATKASCRTCHDQYKDKYKKEMRARKI